MDNGQSVPEKSYEKLHDNTRIYISAENIHFIFNSISVEVDGLLYYWKKQTHQIPTMYLQNM